MRQAHNLKVAGSNPAPATKEDAAHFTLTVFPILSYRTIDATEVKMATLRKRKGKWTVEIRRKGHRNVYATFVQKSDARGFINKVENEIQQQKYKDISVLFFKKSEKE